MNKLAALANAGYLKALTSTAREKFLSQGERIPDDYWDLIEKVSGDLVESLKP